MAPQRLMMRLLLLREIEEEQSRLDLEFALAERDRIQAEFASAQASEHWGRRIFAMGIEEGRASVRTEGAVVMEDAKARQLRTVPRLDEADSEVKRQQEEFLRRRTSRLQVETVVENQRAVEAFEAGRRAQQMLDDWFGRRSQKGRPLR